MKREWMEREWMKNNVIESFSITEGDVVFYFSVHPQNPSEDMSRLLSVHVMDDDGISYGVALHLSKSDDVRLKANEIVENAGKRWIKEHKNVSDVKENENDQ